MTAPHTRRVVTAAVAVAIVALNGCRGGSDDAAAVAEEARHESCVALLRALDIENDPTPDDAAIDDAEAAYAEAAREAKKAAEADSRYEDFAAAVGGAGFKRLRKDGDQVVFFTTCASEARSSDDDLDDRLEGR